MFAHRLTSSEFLSEWTAWLDWLIDYVPTTVLINTTQATAAGPLCRMGSPDALLLSYSLVMVVTAAPNCPSTTALQTELVEPVLAELQEAQTKSGRESSC